MTTRKLRAVNLTTRNQIVEQGPRRREGYKICEIRVNEATGVVDARVRVNDHMESRSYALRDEIRVIA